MSHLDYPFQDDSLLAEDPMTELEGILLDRANRREPDPVDLYTDCNGYAVAYPPAPEESLFEDELLAA